MDQADYGVTYDEFNAFCGTLPATTYTVQWGHSHRIVSLGLSRKRQRELGLNQE